MMELLVGILGAIATIAASISGYFLGLRQGRKQHIYEQRVRAVTEIRSKLRAVQQDFLSWSAPSEYRLEEDPSRLETVQIFVSNPQGWDTADKNTLTLTTVAVK